MGRRVDLDELIDAHEVAELLGLTHPNTVHQYQDRYPDMPRPVMDRGPRRVRLWLKPEMEEWIHRRASAGGNREGGPAR